MNNDVFAVAAKRMIGSFAVIVRLVKLRREVMRVSVYASTLVCVRVCACVSVCVRV